MRKQWTLGVAMIFAAVPLAALSVISDALASALVRSGQLALVMTLLFAGATVQVVSALLKTLAYSYVSTAGAGAQGALLAWCEWHAEQAWPEILLDAATIAAFGYVAWVVLTISPRL
jgi:hypothetical protein